MIFSPPFYYHNFGVTYNHNTIRQQPIEEVHDDQSQNDDDNERRNLFWGQLGRSRGGFGHYYLKTLNQ